MAFGDYCLKATRAGHLHVPFLFVKAISYDNTPANKMSLRSRYIVDGTDLEIVESCRIPQAKLMVHEVKLRAVARKVFNENHFLHWKGAWVTKPTFLQHGRGKDLYVSRQETHIGNVLCCI